MHRKRHTKRKFLKSTPASAIRSREYIHPLVQLKREVLGTVVDVGSARIESHATAQTRCTRLNNQTLAESAPSWPTPRDVVRVVFAWGGGGRWGGGGGGGGGGGLSGGLAAGEAGVEFAVNVRYYEAARHFTKADHLVAHAVNLGRGRFVVLFRSVGPGNQGSSEPRSYEAGGNLSIVDRVAPTSIRKSPTSARSSASISNTFHAQLWFRRSPRPDRVSGLLAGHGRNSGNAHAAANRSLPSRHYSHLWPHLLDEVLTGKAWGRGATINERVPEVHFAR